MPKGKIGVSLANEEVLLFFTKSTSRDVSRQNDFKQSGGSIVGESSDNKSRNTIVFFANQTKLQHNRGCSSSDFANSVF